MTAKKAAGKVAKKKASKKKGRKKRTRKKRQHKKPDPQKPGPERVFDMDHKTLEALGRLQCTQQEMASFFGCSRDAVKTRFKVEVKAREAYEKGRAAGVISLRRRIWRKGVVQGDGPTLRHLANNYAGMSESSTTRHAGHDGGALETGGGMTAEVVRAIKSQIFGIPEKDLDEDEKA